MVFDMSFPILKMSHYCSLLSLSVLLFAVLYSYGLRKKRDVVASTSSIQAAMSKDAKDSRSNDTASKPIHWYRNMFFQLQNLEDHPAALEPAREELLAMFSRGISLALKQPCGSILPIEHYNAKRVWTFVEDEQDKVMTKWGSYLERRKQGQGPELFATVEAAKVWLVQQAPVKFVDGAWLANTHKITSPFALRSVTKAAWQILSEELGDGDLSKHHVYLYRQLLEDIGCPLPDGHSADFIQPCLWDRVNNRGTWEAAVGQLLISLQRVPPRDPRLQHALRAHYPGHHASDS